MSGLPVLIEHFHYLGLFTLLIPGGIGSFERSGIRGR